ncbi:hypothetical protein BOTBODRAFT_28936 [Botryobasidium botryosum FD-172 SS1]|uniref:Methyltransferase domain-containing protein n=1 Tax=Botryobasidium botryosum (strain FD-172 SS1) TaxID=930990 RepID=A0A067MSG5_BOTB1|nr:hypothetical protein BOTBODRAFT_28936 [Botryobasidium botryosum FD-172 SS1]
MASHADHIEANKQHFNSTAHTYDDKPLAVQLSRDAADAMREVYDFKEESTVMLDYACGTGLISQNLAPDCKQIVGVDISEKMVEHYNARVANQGIPPEEMRAVCTDLSGKGELEGLLFDVIVCAQAYHHILSIEDVTKNLFSYLKPGGALLVVDLVRGKHAADFHSQASEHVVAHRGGFIESEIRAAFEDAGLGQFEWGIAAEVRSQGRELELFIAKGVKPI